VCPKKVSIGQFRMHYNGPAIGPSVIKTTSWCFLRRGLPAALECYQTTAPVMPSTPGWYFSQLYPP